MPCILSELWDIIHINFNNFDVLSYILMLLWLLCRESYAETLRQQEEKRKQRMEMERRYEQEYHERQLMESKCQISVFSWARSETVSVC